MVTSNKLPDKKVVKMADQNNSVVVPQRTLLGEVNEHITCPLCRGYYIDATTIVECLHSFCRSCIIKHLQVNSYCPVCEMLINSAKPNIKLDKALQDIVYKLVPGLFQKEMERRQQFYSSRPGPAASATPEQRGEDTERIIFSPEDVISFSLEYADVTDADSISSKSSDSNEPQPITAITRRFLQCPAVVNISHLKKFLTMKFDIDSTQYAIDILYKRVPLPDYYTLMDIAYIFNWKRNEPMRFIYQIIDYSAIRNRLFDVNRKGSHFQDRKSSPATTEDVSNPAPLNDHGSEASSGSNSPMPDESSSKNNADNLKNNEKPDKQDKGETSTSNSSITSKNEDVEKSQFLNSFELTAKNCVPVKSPVKNSTDIHTTSNAMKLPSSPTKSEETLKRRQQVTSHNIPEMKKLKIELEKTKLPNLVNVTNSNASPINPTVKSIDTISPNSKETDVKSPQKNTVSTSITIKDPKSQTMSVPKHQISESSGGIKQNITTQNVPASVCNIDPHTSSQSPTIVQKVSPIKLQIPKPESQMQASAIDTHKPTFKKIPDLKPSNLLSQPLQTKGQLTNKVRMDLLANNSDPTIDRSKILSQTSPSIQSPGQASGDPLKSLFDSCKINIPSSLSITLTDQKQEVRVPGEIIKIDQNKGSNLKNTTGPNSSVPKIPSPSVPNYIEILKLPDTDTKKQLKPDTSIDNKTTLNNKSSDNITVQQKPLNKPPETSSKGPVPNLKPISDTKLAKQSTTNVTAPITFQQTFEQQLLQSDKKPKLPKNKAQVPKLVPANPKVFNAVNKLNPNKPAQSSVYPLESKTSAALDLSTPHNIQSQLSPHQTKAFETMQSIANLAKKQSLQSKGTPHGLSQNFSTIRGRTLNTGLVPLRVPSSSNISQLKPDKSSSHLPTNNIRPEVPKIEQMKTPNNPTTVPSYQISLHNSPSTTQPSPRSQTRSPSSSPKLVIAEEKQGVSVSESNNSHLNQITSTQVLNNPSKSELPKNSPGSSKTTIKPTKPPAPPLKLSGIRQPITPRLKTNPSPADIQLMSHQAQQALFRRQMEMSAAWFKAQTSFDMSYKNISNLAHQTQNDFNRDKQ